MCGPGLVFEIGNECQTRISTDNHHVDQKFYANLLGHTLMYVHLVIDFFKEKKM